MINRWNVKNEKISVLNFVFILIQNNGSEIYTLQLFEIDTSLVVGGQHTMFNNYLRSLVHIEPLKFDVPQFHKHNFFQIVVVF